MVRQSVIELVAELNQRAYGVSAVRDWLLVWTRPWTDRGGSFEGYASSAEPQERYAAALLEVLVLQLASTLVQV